VIAGFQGVSPDGRITTLGRGGSDTTAVAFAAALGPSAATSTPMSTASTPPTRAWCDGARKLDRISYEEMLELASLGAKVLQTRSVELAMRYKVRLQVLSSFEDARHAGLRRGGNHGIEGRQRRRLPARRGQGDAAGRRRPPRHRRLDLRPARRGRRQCRHDRAEHLEEG
jgi:hypothetical protein